MQDLLESWYKGEIDADAILRAAEELGWAEEDYEALCVYEEEDDAWYPKVELGAPHKDYSIVDHALDFLRRLAKEE